MGNPSKESLTPLFNTTIWNYVFRGLLSRDGVKFFLECKIPPTDKDGNASQPIPSFDEIIGLVLTRIPREFVHEDVIRHMAERLKTGKPLDRRRVAAGVPPKPGRAGKLLLLVKPLIKNAVSERPVDPRFIRRFDNIEPGTVVARVYPPVNGSSGTSVLGEEIQSQNEEPYPVKLDSTISEEKPDSSSYSCLVAQTYGYLQVSEHTLHIEEVLSVKNDIDYRVGDVEFVGKVTIGGGIMKDFSVSARGDIAVKKNVLGNMYSQLGSISVEGNISRSTTPKRVITNGPSIGLMGRLEKEKNTPSGIHAAEDVSASIVDNAMITAGGNIIIKREARGATLRSGGSILLKTGHFTSGKAVCVNGIEAETLGTKGGASVEILLCSSIESSSEYAECLKEIVKAEAADKIASLYLGPLVDDPSLIEKAPESKRTSIRKTLEKHQFIRSRLEALNKTKEALLDGSCVSETAQVNYTKALYQGVRISCGEHIFLVEEDYLGKGSIEFDNESQTFKQVPYHALKCKDESNKE